MNIDQIKFVFAVAFVVLLAVAFITMSARVVELRLRKHAQPRLLTRDILFFAGFVWFVGAILFVRAAGITGIGDEPVWVFGTSIPPLLALVVWDYYELFVIGRKS